MQEATKPLFKPLKEYNEHPNPFSVGVPPLRPGPRLGSPLLDVMKKKKKKTQKRFLTNIPAHAWSYNHI